MDSFKEPTANLRKPDWKMEVIMIVLGLSIVSVIGFMILSNVYDVTHPQSKTTSNDNPILTFLPYMILPIIIIGGRLITSRKKKSVYNSEGRLVR